ncbi:Uncharacterised protein [Legionella geestiana]|nr:Uncharacterised protein [Legionella geestiana]
MIKKFIRKLYLPVYFVFDTIQQKRGQRMMMTHSLKINR